MQAYGNLQGKRRTRFLVIGRTHCVPLWFPVLIEASFGESPSLTLCGQCHSLKTVLFCRVCTSESELNTLLNCKMIPKSLWKWDSFSTSHYHLKAIPNLGLVSKDAAWMRVL